MKTLFLVRHAKSSWDDATLSDRERPLNERGLREVQEMGRRLAERGVKPDLVISSPAVRARATAEAIAKMLDYKRKAIVVNDRLYAARADNVFHVIQELGDKPRRVMLVGHNPEFTDLAHHFSSQIIRMPTCAIAEFTFDAMSWSEIRKTKPIAVAFDHPKKSSQRHPAHRVGPVECASAPTP
ncbi:SixA phosphatase family protein [Piscinibacter sp.]|jgi:phosphohistidine phosphatase|uniref:SixA phosphatase family protein n=1 Tax=Piscinibacter sp. TaxID=1903157 RepID=UPI00355A067F